MSHVAQGLRHFSPALLIVVHLELEVWHKETEEDWEGRQLKGTDDVEWLHLLHQFPTVQTLCVSQERAGHVAFALENIAWETVAEVLPSLDLIYLAGQLASSIKKFIAARYCSSLAAP